MSDDETLQAEIDELLKEVKEMEKRSYELKQAAVRQLSYGITAYIAPPKSPTTNEEK